MAACSTCSAPLCEECILSQEDGQIFCDRCAAVQAASQAVEEIKQHEQKTIESRHARKTRQKRQVIIFRTVFALFVVMALAGNGYLYFKHGRISGIEEPTLLDSRIFAASEVDNAIQDYMEANNGKVPESLNALSKTESIQAVSQVDLDQLTYHKLSPTQYELIVKDLDATPIIFIGGEE